MTYKDNLPKKKVLLVTDATFWEGKMGSHQRILTMSKYLKDKCNFKVFLFSSIGAVRRQQIEQAGFKDSIISYKNFDQHAKPETIGLPELSSYANFKGLRKRRHDAFYTTFAQYINQETPDVVIIEYIYLAYLLDAVPSNCTTVIDTHDVMCLREYRFYQHKLHHTISMSVSFQEEQLILNRFDVALAIQKHEYRILQAMLPEKVILCCPHSISNSDTNLIVSNIQNFGFIGSDNEANRSGLSWFLNQVWPVVRQLGVKLLIFGKVGDRFQEICDLDQSIHNMSDKLSQEEIYNSVDCMINPVFVGGGLKIKTLESLAYGKPIVSSMEGSVGIDNQGQNGIVVARNRSEFIEGLIRLIQQPSFARELIKQGKEVIDQQFSPQACYEPLSDLIKYC